MEVRDAELIDYIQILWRWRWFVALGTLVCVGVAAGLSLMLPKVYRITATVDTGNLSEERAKEVERLVAHVNAGGFLEGMDPAARQERLAAQFKKPFLIEVSTETREPARTVRSLEKTTTRVVEELSRMLSVQQTDEEATAAAVQAALDAARKVATSLLSQLRIDLDRRVRHAEAELGAARVGLDRLKQEQGLLQRRVEQLRRELEGLSVERSAVLRQVETPAMVLALGQISMEMGVKAITADELERELAASLPGRAGVLAREVQRLTDRVVGLNAAREILRQSAPTDGAARSRAVLEALYRVAAPGSPDADFAEKAARTLETEIPARLRELERQANQLALRATTIRTARVLLAPESPGDLVRPRLRLNLAVGLGVGLVSTVLLAFVLEYLLQAQRRRASAGPAQAAG